MMENTERIVRVGLTRGAKAIFDEIESITAGMIREGWNMRESFIEESLGKVHLIFERAINEIGY
jgi:hypothetical protein